MNKQIYRIYLLPDRHGRMQQTHLRTRDFYDIDLRQYREAAHTRWYRIIRSSPGNAFNSLWKAGNPEAHDGITISNLGAFMRLFSSLWYVDRRDVRLEDAADLAHSPLTHPKALALSLALIVIAYSLVAGLFSSWSGQPLPAIQPLARFCGIAMLCLLGVELFLGRLKKALRELRGI